MHKSRTNHCDTKGWHKHHEGRSDGFVTTCISTSLVTIRRLDYRAQDWLGHSFRVPHSLPTDTMCPYLSKDVCQAVVTKQPHFLTNKTTWTIPTNYTACFSQLLTLHPPVQDERQVGRWKRWCTSNGDISHRVACCYILFRQTRASVCPNWWDSQYRKTSRSRIPQTVSHTTKVVIIPKHSRTCCQGLQLN